METNPLRTMGMIFLVIALALVVVGFVRDDYFWYIRAVIFCVGALFVFWKGEKIAAIKIGDLFGK